MPTYEFECDPDNGGCGHRIEISCTYAEKEDNQPKSCPKCRKRKPLYEVFGGGNSVFIPVTIGSLIDKNNSRISADEKHHLNKKHNEYKERKEPSMVEQDGRFVRNPDMFRG